MQVALVEEIPVIKGIWNIAAYEGDIRKDENGLILNKKVWEQTKENLIVTAGKNQMLDMLFGLNAQTKITSVGVGDNNTAAAVGQTGLQGTTNVLIQTADAGTSRTAQTVTIVSTFGTGVANFAWAECGLFNGNVNNTSTMFNRIVIGPFTKTTAVSIVLTIQITQS